MTVLQERRQAWDVIFSDPNLSEQSLQQRGISGTVCEKGLRSVCWKVYFGYLPNLNVSTWPAIQMNERKRYTDLRRQYIEEPAELMTKKSDNLTDNNPLALNESNPWQQYFADSEIRKVIRQDVDRTFPDVEFFRSEAVQEKMTDILFIYCKIHHDVSYRQGMHELLAPIYWNIATESLDGVSSDEVDACLSDPANRLMVQVLDPAFVEHDAFLLFDRLMTYARPWYEFNNTLPAKSLNRRSKSAMDLTSSDNNKLQQTNLNPVVGVCQRIHHQYLRLVDPPLYKHLENFGIEPQLFGIRWLRLLFGREFEFFELLRLWDAIFAQDPTLEIVEFVCLAILLRLHDQLIENDYAECLSLLMRGTRISKPITLVEQAKYLQGNLSHDGALQILRQNDLRAGKEPRASLWKNDLETAALPYQRQQQQQQQQRRQQVSSNLDNFTNITRGVMKSSQVRDLNKTIAGVMGTVQKNVNLFGDNVLGRNTSMGGNSQRRRLTVSSEFPDGIDRIAPSSGQFQYQSSNTLPRSTSINSMQRASTNTYLSSTSANNNDNQNANAAALATIQKVNRQMGGLMAQCIDVLEKELFSTNTTPQQSSSSTTSTTTPTKPAPTTQAAMATTEKDGVTNDCDVSQQEETEKQADDGVNATTDQMITNENGSVDEHSADDNATTPTVSATGTTISASDDQKKGPDEASLTLALAGLKHIRDVLQGKQLQFDSNVLDLDLAASVFTAKDKEDSASPRTSREHVDLTKKPLPNIQQKHAPNVHQQQQQQQHYIPEPEKTRIDSPVTATTPSPTRAIPATATTTTSTTSPSNKYIPTGRPKQQQVPYSIEDLLSDPALQTSGGRGSDEHHTTNNKKLQWMIDKDMNESMNQLDTSGNTTSITSSSNLFSNDKDSTTSTLEADNALPILGQNQQQPHHHRPTSRQRSSINLNRAAKSNATPTTDTTINHVDPLDAKNVDKRYSYEYDIYH